MIKLTLREMRMMTPGLNAILGIDLPAKPAYWLARWLDRSSSEMKAVEGARLQLVKKYVGKDKDGKLLRKKDKNGKQLNQYDFTDENMEKFNKEFEKLLETEVEVDFKPIKLADLDSEVCEKCGQKKLKIKPIILFQLGKIIVE
jgi:hypothetical protein